MVGRTVAQYQLLEKLGAGGMGEIYKAQDGRLNRFVAVKVLTMSSAGDPERRRRFILEAQAASALNHPNIIIIHDIVSDGDSDFMVMEYIQGKTLVDLIPKGGLRLPLALKYAVQMTDALTVAHQAGIVHRDLKPANVMITENGLVKILDFGLAKLTDRGPVTQAGSDATQTLASAPLTVEGSIIGTVSYMSPEQAQGKKVDTRSDIFSFGVLLYEMVTGVRAFGGDNAVSTLSAILRDEAKPIAEVAPDVPPQIEQLIKRCLRKRPEDRWQSMQDVRAALAALKHESDSGQLYKPRIPGPAKKSAPPLAMIGAAAALVLIAAGGGSWWLVKHRRAKAAAEAAAAVVPVAAPAPAPTPAPAPPPEPAAAKPPEPADGVLTNDQIIELVEAKVPTPVILGQIHSSKTNFALSPGELIRLTKAGVSASIIEAMRDPKAVRASNPARERPTAKPVPAQPSAIPPAPIPSVASAAPPVIAPPVVTAPPVAAAPKAPEKVVLATVPDGTPVRLTLSADIPADAPEGTPLRFTVAAPVRAGEGILVAKGAVVTGQIVEAAKKKFLGIGGKMQYQLNQVGGADGHKLGMRATPGKPQEGVARRQVENPNQKHSKEIAAEAGAEYIGYIDGDQTVSLKK